MTTADRPGERLAYRLRLVAGFVLLAAVLATVMSLPVAAQNVPPVMALTAPANGATYVGLATIELRAQASDSDGVVRRVQYLRNGHPIGSASQPPYSYTWTNVIPGTYLITARAFDSAGASGTSEAVTIEVSNPISVSMQTPAAGARYVPPGPVPLQAAASSSRGSISRIDYHAGGILIATSSTPPFTASWNNVAAGVHGISAIATDSQGISQQSRAVAVIIDTPADVSLTSPAPDAAYVSPAAIPLVAQVVDAEQQVIRVRFYNGSQLLGTATTPPYSFNWTNVAPGSYQLQAKAATRHGELALSPVVQVSVAPPPPPVIGIRSPADGTLVNAPGTVNLAADAQPGTADGRIAQVEFFRDGQSLGVLTAAPYVLTLTDLTAGSYLLNAVATDGGGRTTASAPVSLRVNAAPLAFVQAPSAGATVISGTTVDLQASAVDSDGSVVRVDFYYGSTLIGSAGAAPYTTRWIAPAPGAYSLSARAVDDNGSIGTSEPVAITVVSNTPPLVSLQGNAGATTPLTAPAQVQLTAVASDSDGQVSKVEFLSGATLLATRTEPPYTFSWQLSEPGTYTAYARATDNLGATSRSADLQLTVNARPAAIYFIHTDQLNTPRVITDSAANIVWKWTSDPFGATPPNEDPRGTGNAFQCNLRFPGQYFDGETGLHYNYFRDYDPGSGRYLQSDPIGLRGGLNTFGYVRNSPLRYTDRRGLDVSPDDGIRRRPVFPNPFDVFIPGSPANQVFSKTVFRMWKSVRDFCANAAEGEAAPPTPHLDADAERHILDGDDDGSGGHRAGTGRPGKSEFPASWTDEKILDEVRNVAGDSNSVRMPSHSNNSTIEGARDGVDIRVVVDSTGRIVTAYPYKLPQNPR